VHESGIIGLDQNITVWHFLNVRKITDLTGLSDLSGLDLPARLSFRSTGPTLILAYQPDSYFSLPDLISACPHSSNLISAYRPDSHFALPIRLLFQPARSLFSLPAQL
jgi:hypothetical protein